MNSNEGRVSFQKIEDSSEEHHFEGYLVKLNVPTSVWPRNLFNQGKEAIKKAIFNVSNEIITSQTENRCSLWSWQSQLQIQNALKIKEIK